jgi:hypothetical protein
MENINGGSRGRVIRCEAAVLYSSDAVFQCVTNKASTILYRDRNSCRFVNQCNSVCGHESPCRL